MASKDTQGITAKQAS